jgi:hypothetical protein
VPLSILYFGADSPSTTSKHRADALTRLGLHLTIVNPLCLISHRSRLHAFCDYRTGYIFLQRNLLKGLVHFFSTFKETPSLIWIDSGELFGPSSLKFLLDKFACPIVLYNIDDPTGSRDYLRFHLLRRSLRFYSICAFIRRETSIEALAYGARQVLTVHRSYDEVHHLQPDMTSMQCLYERVVSFVGTMIPGERRDHFLLALKQAGLPLRLIGDRWNRSLFWLTLKPIYQGTALAGAAYSQVLARSALSLGLLSHHNRDLVTTRSYETPASGGVLCAERTSEHQLLYEDYLEAVFWDSTDQCVQRCQEFLDDPTLRNNICLNGHHHLLQLGVGNEDICRQILLCLGWKPSSDFDCS